MFFENAVQLNALAGGEAESSIAVGAGQVVNCEILLSGQTAAGNLAANHEDIFFAAAGEPGRHR